MLQKIASDLIAFNNKENENTRLLYLEKELADLEKSMDNLIKAVEQGFFNEKTQSRMLELQSKKAELVAEIDDEKLNIPIPLVYDEVLFWFMSFKNGDTTCEKFRERLISTFVNRVIIWNNRVVIIFNVKDGQDNEKLTVDELLDLYNQKNPTHCFEFDSIGDPCAPVSETILRPLSISTLSRIVVVVNLLLFPSFAL